MTLLLLMAGGSPGPAVSTVAAPTALLQEAPVRYELYLCTDLGERIMPLEDWVSFEYTMGVNDIGWTGIVMNGEFDARLLQKDRQLQIWRQPTGGRLALDSVAFLLHWFYRTRNKVTTTILKGPDQNDLLTRRIVAYAAASSRATTTAEVDDAMKDVFNENLIGGVTDSDRDLSSYDLTVQTDLTAGTAIEKAFAWKPAWDVLRDMGDASRTDGTEVFFGIYQTGVDLSDNRVQFQFQTMTGQPGQDRTWINSNNPVIFGEAWGNLENPTLEYDYRGEINYVYALGQGQEADRDSAEVTDSTRINVSTWGRREGYRDARHVKKGNSAELTDEANAMLAANRPRVRFSGDIQDTEQARYGRDWKLGDKVTAMAYGIQFDAIIRAIHIRVDASGREDIKARIENESV